MKALWRQTRSFSPTARLLMANQFAINVAFFMLMPYLAEHLAGDLGLAAWAVGLVLGVRNLSQQGMFAVGGALADRFGYKTPIIAGCLLRTVGFAMLGLAADLPALVAASAATGLAGALFNPAVRAYLAAEAGERRVEAFAVFNVYYQAGMLAGPLVGLALLTADFAAVCTASAAVFALLAILQWRSLPSLAGVGGETASLRAGWRTVAANRPFWLFTAAMSGSYVLTFQVYLALPLALKASMSTSHARTATSGLFVVSAAVTVIGQLRLTGWAKRRLPPHQAISGGLAVCGLAFGAPLFAVSAGSAPILTVTAVGLAAAALAAGAAVVYPFEMDTLLGLAADRLVATHYGLYNTVCGVGITIGNLAVGSLWGFGERYNAAWLPWAALTLTGLATAAAVAALARTGRLAPGPAPQPIPAAA